MVRQEPRAQLAPRDRLEQALRDPQGLLVPRAPPDLPAQAQQAPLVPRVLPVLLDLQAYKAARDRLDLQGLLARVAPLVRKVLLGLLDPQALMALPGSLALPARLARQDRKVPLDTQALRVPLALVPQALPDLQVLVALLAPQAQALLDPPARLVRKEMSVPLDQQGRRVLLAPPVPKVQVVPQASMDPRERQVLWE